jgi:hypothetical protein
MLTFNPTSSPNLFAAPGGDIWILYYWPPPRLGPPPPTQPVPLDQAWTGPGAFLFATAPGRSIDPVVPALVSAIEAAIENSALSNSAHCVAWLTDPDQIVGTNIFLFGIGGRAPNYEVQPGIQLPLIPNNLVFNIGQGTSLVFSSDNETVTLTPSANNVYFDGNAAPQSARILSATLAFSGAAAGTLQFATAIKRSELYTKLRWGSQLLYDTRAATQTPIRSQWYPLADGTQPNGADMLAFAISVDTGDPTNARVANRTYLAFTGEAETLVSGFRTAFGDAVLLRPIGAPQAGEQQARLILAYGNPNAPSAPDYSFGPQGDFIMMLAPPKDGSGSELLCGLTPTETLSFTAGPAADSRTGNRLRFTANLKAFVTSYPSLPAVPLQPPIDPHAAAMSDKYRTPWATIVPGPAQAASQYSAQPKGSSLFGFDKVVATTGKSVLGFVDPGYALTRPDPFPLMPYGLAPLDEFGVSFSEQEIAGVEQFAAAPTRRSTIGAPGVSRPSRARRMHAAAADNGNPDWVTTPSGLLAELDSSGGHWSSVVLGVNYDAGPMWMVFNDPTPPLQQALQTSNLFLVAVNGTNLGKQAGKAIGPQPPKATGTATFYNTMAIQDWEITAAVGQSNVYNGYNNVLIIKGCKGKLVDLVAKPAVWTQPADFSIPGTDQSELLIVSQWIAAYIADARKQTSPYFTNFNSIVTDENWTGILVLKASLTGLPQNLSGLLSVIDKSQCFAHHLGVTITPVTIDRTQPEHPTIGITNSSAIFEFVYYVNPAFDQANPEPLPPQSSPYDFKLLTLEALFENTAVKSFDSYAQLTLGDFFGDGVTRMADPANIYNTIMLKGAYQQNGGVGTFMLDSVGDNLFFLKSAAINKVEVTKAQFNTIGPTSLRFDLWGFIDFNVLYVVDTDTQKQDVPFDLFGFGFTDDPNAPRQGVSFAGLSINLDTSGQPGVFGFNVGAITFDPSRSTVRKGSLCSDFALTLQTLLTGDDSSSAKPPTDPGSLNFLNVPTNAPLSGVAGGRWYALQFAVDLGSVGALASSAGLNASMIAAWAPSGSQNGAPSSAAARFALPVAFGDDPAPQTTFYDAMCGLRLPGVTAKAKLLSLEGVLALSIGDIRLTYAPASAGETQRYWVLWLSDIALKFLGLLKIPPNGAISFACFGNPKADGKQSALGWYAVYNQDKKKKGDKVLAALPRSAHLRRGAS